MFSVFNCFALCFFSVVPGNNSHKSIKGNETVASNGYSLRSRKHEHIVFFFANRFKCQNGNRIESNLLGSNTITRNRNKIVI